MIDPVGKLQGGAFEDDQTDSLPILRLSARRPIKEVISFHKKALFNLADSSANLNNNIILK